MTDAAITDATAGAPPLPAPLVPADGLPQSSSAGATVASGDGGKIAEALAKAQGEIRNPGKDRTAQIKSDKGSYSYSYTTLADGIAAIRGPLSKHGIAWVQITHVDGDFLMLTTSLIHAVSGETLDATWPVGAYAKLTPQQMGSSLTYGKRYSLFSLVGIAGADEDDDGNAASGKGKEDDEDDIPIDTRQLAQIQELLTETKSNLEIFFDTLGVSTFSDMSVKHYQRALVLLNEKRRRMREAAAP
jgi:hypothetical protein